MSRLLSDAELAQFVQELRDHFPPDSGINLTGRSGGLIRAVDIIAGYDAQTAELARLQRVADAGDHLATVAGDVCGWLGATHLSNTGHHRSLQIATNDYLIADALSDPPADAPEPQGDPCAVCGGSGKDYGLTGTLAVAKCYPCNGTGRTP